MADSMETMRAAVSVESKVEHLELMWVAQTVGVTVGMLDLRLVEMKVEKWELM